MAALGVWQDGIVPGIFTLDKIAHDVHQKHLRFSQAHVEVGHEMKACLVNAKGFGGNNATALLLSPSSTEALLTRRHGQTAITAWQHAREATRAKAAAYDAAASKGNFQVRYRFGEGVVDGGHLTIDSQRISIPGYGQTVSIDVKHPYAGYLYRP